MNVDELIHDDVEDLRALEEELRNVIDKIVNDRRAIRDGGRRMAGVTQQHVEFLRRRLAHNEREAANIGQWIREARRRIDDFHTAPTPPPSPREQKGSGVITNKIFQTISNKGRKGNPKLRKLMPGEFHKIGRASCREGV